MFWKKKKLTYELQQSLQLDTPLQDMSFTVFDTETTGFAIGANDRMIEIGAVQVEGFHVTDRMFQTFVNPSREIPPVISKLTNIQQSQVDTAPMPLPAIEEYFAFIEKNKSGGWVGHHVSFDEMVIKKELGRQKCTFEMPTSFDTMHLIRYLDPTGEQQDLEDYAKIFGTEVFERHRALGDALTTAHVFTELLKKLDRQGVKTLADLLRIKNGGAHKFVSQT
ncbi:3'-5' exonuclease [Sporosarcina sp. PTS2304]|uniref:3'-5' exonuclease n=1 Tax=Sporosarcina sp. PTS2304 TaxID=2283194 RepID=UPI000E0CE7D6|nr:exonuclease domain-containing protein [Sporosarcina sp. PTS2304]AXH99507.1 3'-5' exonuclease [Sporosarcina sp. PTS2304]